MLGLYEPALKNRIAKFYEKLPANILAENATITIDELLAMKVIADQYHQNRQSYACVFPLDWDLKMAECCLRAAWKLACTSKQHFTECEELLTLANNLIPEDNKEYRCYFHYVTIAVYHSPAWKENS
ncbi:MAG: hypothetical protein KIT27_01855 [Legionellales bacterium]|nr:hypothetical protein [Legionellales bacterium]